jgi:hypothetical protein
MSEQLEGNYSSYDSSADSCVVTGLTNGTPYYFKVFTMDANGNYSSGVPAATTGTPITTTTVANGTESGNITIAPGATATSTNTFTFQTSSGTDVITALVLNLSSASSTSKVEITNDAGTVVYGSSTNPTGAATTSITLNNSTLTASTTLTQYRVRITPKTQANMPSGSLGMLYPVVASVNTWTGTNTNKVNTDTASYLLTIDNEAPATTQNTGVTWSTSTSAANDTWNSVTYGNGLFVAVAATTTSNKSVMTSPDGVTWTQRTATTTNNSWRSVTYGNGLFVAVTATSTNKNVMTSPDGITWTLRTGQNLNTVWNSVTYGGGVFVAVGGDYSYTDSIMYSVDGITWLDATSDPLQSQAFTSVAYGNGVFVAIASSTCAGSCGGVSLIATSVNGISWTSRSAPNANEWQSITYGNGLFVAVSSSGTGNRVMTSSNGTTWTSRTSAANNSWTSVTYGNGLFVAVSSDGTNRIMTSPDGITWTSQVNPVANQWKSIAYGNGIFTAISSDGTSNRVMKSTSTLPRPRYDAIHPPYAHLPVSVRNIFLSIVSANSQRYFVV